MQVHFRGLLQSRCQDVSFDLPLPFYLVMGLMTMMLWEKSVSAITLLYQDETKNRCIGLC